MDQWGFRFLLRMLGTLEMFSLDSIWNKLETRKKISRPTRVHLVIRQIAMSKNIRSFTK